MKIIYNWLRDFVDVTAAPNDLASRLALSGTNIGGIENGAHGAVIDAEVSSNRPDCLGHYGIAREVSAVYKLPLKPVPPKPHESAAAKASDAVRVEIQSPELCGRFTARVIRGARIQPSPQWLKDRLEASGVATINNVVDVSNYVMLELGHALHAFDYDKVRDHRIVVRRAKPSEKIRTLDGIERTLDTGICMICDGDGSRAVGIGGIMGGDTPDKQIESSLSALGFAPVRIDQNRGAEGSLLAAWECTQPSWRAEVEREIDLIEEVARVYGLDKFPPRLPAARQGAARLPHFDAEARLREGLIGLGYREILTIPHVAEDRDALFRPLDANPARLANPLSEEASVLKSTGIVTMTAALEWNLNRGQRNVRLFEIGRHYRLRGSESVETPILTIGATGEAREKGLYDTARDYSFADLKGDLDALAALAGGFTWNEGGPSWLHPARRGRVALHNEAIGEAGELARRVAEQLKLRQEIFLAELHLPPLHAAIRDAEESRKYESVPRFPAVERDFSLLLADGTHFADIVSAIRSLNISEIASIEAIDLYRGKNVPAGQYSLLIRVTFQSRESTLAEAQLTDFSARIVATLEKQLSARLRTS